MQRGNSGNKRQNSSFHDKSRFLPNSRTSRIFSRFLFVIWGASHILNAPVLTMYRFGIYFSSFLIGYYVFSHEKVQNAIEKLHIPLLIGAIISAAVYAATYFGSDYTAPECLQSILTNLFPAESVRYPLTGGKTKRR